MIRLTSSTGTLRRGRAPLVLASVLALGGCGSNAKDQVKAKVVEFGQAAAKHDYRRICDDVLAPALTRRLRAYGISCERAMRIAFTGVRNPAISIGVVDVKERTASVTTLSMASGQQASLQTIQLVKTDRGWRIASLRAL